MGLHGIQAMSEERLRVLRLAQEKSDLQDMGLKKTKAVAFPAVELIDAEIAQSFSQQRKKRDGGGPTYHETFAYAQGPFARDFVHVWHPHNQNVGATGSGLSGVATVSSTLGVLRAYSPNSTSASSSNLSTVHMGGLTCITQPTTELGSEDTVIAQFLSNPAQVGPSESPVLFSGTVGAASTFSPLASNDLPEISAMVPPPSTSADRLGPVLLGCIRDVLWHGHFLRYFSLQLIGDNSVLFHYRYLLILDRTNWKTNMLTALLVPYIFFTLPNVLFSLIRGEVGKWIAIIAVILRLFFPRHFTDWLELPGSIILLTAVAPSLFAHTFRDDLVGVFICLAIGCYLLQEHIRASDGLRNAFRKGNGVSNSIGILLLFIYPVWTGVLRIL
eukprot:XP_020399422.1 uncharacterized protein LOC109942168 [Zea mays]